jgi:hypothetical protein
MGGGDDHDFPRGWNAIREGVARAAARNHLINARAAVRFYATNAADASPPAA